MSIFFKDFSIEFFNKKCSQYKIKQFEKSIDIDIDLILTYESRFFWSDFEPLILNRTRYFYELLHRILKYFNIFLLVLSKNEQFDSQR